MKTTLEINDPLLLRAKRLAAERNTTLRMVVESALRRYLDAMDNGQRPSFRLRRHTFGGRGLQAGLDEHDWEAIRELIYEGRGG